MMSEIRIFRNNCHQGKAVVRFLSVAISEAVSVVIFRTERGWLGIVHAMLHRRQRP